MTAALSTPSIRTSPGEGAQAFSGQTRFCAPFPSGYRASGVLLHVTSLPSPYGVGDLGPAAYAWVDCLAAAGQTWWQVLPLGPTGCGHSPYQALSSFAANPLVISPDQLRQDGLVEPGDCAHCAFPSDRIDFDRVIPFKERLLACAWTKFRSGARADLRPAFEQFREKEAALHEAALFMALRAKYQGAPFREWPEDLVRRKPKALEKARRELAESIDCFRFGQFILLRHWQMLKDYANWRGIRVLGDLPIFASPDSADAWANPQLFLLDDRLQPRVVAGVPPDYFSAGGQLWGNPIYDWDALRKNGYRWWIDRLQAPLQYLDAVRIDHFRGFEAAWHVPAGASTAAAGHWVCGPGAEFFDRVRQALGGGLPLLAEDLGIITPAVTALRDQFQLPGMRVLQFAFNGDPNNPHLPEHCVHNSVVYTGTHDNDTTRGWYEALPEQEHRHLWNYLQRPPGDSREATWELIRLAWSSTSALAIAPLQDVLGLGSAARLNVPGRAEGQWLWRCTEEALTDASWQRLHELTRASART